MQGLLLIDKPEGKTSYGAVAHIKRVSGEKRVGHTGTLDPMATGVLPVLLGRATALSSYLLDADKCYTARIRLGVTTDTCDITGNVISEKAVTVTNDELLKALTRFMGEIKQTPPMFSALKKDGVRLYDLARQGKTVDIPERVITIHSLSMAKTLDQNNEFTIEARVSKGTYIRSLARDIGEALGCGATLTKLRRTETSGFSIDSCIPLADIDSYNISEHILSEETVVSGFPSVTVTENQAKRFCNGGELSFDRLKIKEFANGQLFRVKLGNLFLGLGVADTEKQQLKIRCVINDFR